MSKKERQEMCEIEGESDIFWKRCNVYCLCFISTNQRKESSSTRAGSDIIYYSKFPLKGFKAKGKFCSSSPESKRAFYNVSAYLFFKRGVMDGSQSQYEFCNSQLSFSLVFCWIRDSRSNFLLQLLEKKQQ